MYGDVNRKLEASMDKMKAFIEEVDVDALEELRKEHDQEIKANFAQQTENRAASIERLEKRVAEWEKAVQQSHLETAAEEDEDNPEESSAEAIDATAAVDSDGEVKAKQTRTRTTRKKATDGSAMTNPAAKTRSRKLRKKVDAAEEEAE